MVLSDLSAGKVRAGANDLDELLYSLIPFTTCTSIVSTNCCYDILSINSEA